MIVTLLRRVFFCLLCRKSEKGIKLLVFFSFLSSLLFYLQWNNQLLLRRAKIRDAQNEEEIDQALEIEDEILLTQYRGRLQTGDVTPSNMNFIFHNKFPKCASTTLNYVLLGLARRNKFNYEKINSGSIANSIQEDAPVIYFVQNNFKPPYLLLKHQFWVNFTGLPYEMRPTYINMIRDPLDWVTSRYYFNRYGWLRDPGCRGEGCSMSREEHGMSLDECVEKELHLCTSPSPYFPYLCGPSSACYDHRKDLVYKKTRQRILDEYYFVGILDHFEETLRALEVLLPSYFEGAVEIFKGEQIQKKMKLTQTKNKKTMSEKTRQYYLNGPLKYEAKLYNFAKQVFKERLDFLGIPITSKND